MPHLTSLLVGMHFRPPAKQILSGLPPGTQLTLVLQDDNPYDDQAIAVMLEALPGDFPDAVLNGTGFDRVDLDWPLHLGFVAASGGKPLQKAGLAVGNREFRQARSAWPAEGTLRFGGDGEPLVEMATSGEK